MCEYVNMNYWKAKYEGLEERMKNLRYKVDICMYVIMYICMYVNMWICGCAWVLEEINDICTRLSCTHPMTCVSETHMHTCIICAYMHNVCIYAYMHNICIHT